jgi:microcystin-dependent protein
MGQPYVGEIRIFAGNFAPAGWMLCEGQLLPISEFETLFNLIGTTYGGDGQSTFALPDLRGRVPIHQGTGGGSTYILGQNGGVETVTPTVNQIPGHNHAFLGTSSFGNQSSPAGNVLAQTQAIKIYDSSGPSTPMAPGTTSSTGGRQPHNNLQPYLCVDFIISLFGIYPSQN